MSTASWSRTGKTTRAGRQTAATRRRCSQTGERCVGKQVVPRPVWDQDRRSIRRQPECFRALRERYTSHAVVVGFPGGDGFLDLFGGEVFGKRAVHEVGKVGVRGEAERDQLPFGERMRVCEAGGWKESGDAEAFFKADDAVLDFEGVGAGEGGVPEKSGGHDDPPEKQVAVNRPVMDGRCRWRRRG